MKPYEVKCKCNHTFLVSHSVLWRSLTCPECNRTTWYERNLKGDVRTTKVIGRFKSKKEIERRVYALAKDSATDLFNQSEPTEDQESVGLPVDQDPNNDSPDGSEDQGGSVRSEHQGLPSDTRGTRRSSEEVGKGRLAK